MTRFSEVFGLDKTQAELDFVDIDLDTDMMLFVDPFAISQRPDSQSRQCAQMLTDYFQNLIDLMKTGDDDNARYMLSFLKEPRETRLGFSKGSSQGAGIGKHQAEQVFDALKGSSAVKTGFLSALEECELMVDGIGRDKISDLTTNIIRSQLIEYTQNQCNLHGIPMVSVPVPPCFHPESMTWVSEFHDLPVHDGKQILLVPKVFVRFSPAYQNDKYYRHHVLTYLQAEHLSANSSLVRTLKRGQKRVYKKDLMAIHPHSKEFLYQFSKEHPQVLNNYREKLKKAESDDKAHSLDGFFVEQTLAEALITALDAVPGGNADATTFHKLIIGVLEVIFHPSLVSPKKEQEIHEGRKRIDIVMQNGARDGIFYDLREVRKIQCSFIAIECKNYTRDIANPELDQIGGRFSPLRGKVGIICCRKFEDRQLFIKRCKDTLQDDRGLIIPLDDERIKELLVHIQKGERKSAEILFSTWVNELYF